MHNTPSSVIAGLTATRGLFDHVPPGDVSTSFSCRTSVAAACNRRATTLGGVLNPAKLRSACTFYGEQISRGSKFSGVRGFWHRRSKPHIRHVYSEVNLPRGVLFACYTGSLPTKLSRPPASQHIEDSSANHEHRQIAH